MNTNIAGYDTGLILYCDIPGSTMLRQIKKEYPLINGISVGNILILLMSDSNQEQFTQFLAKYLQQ